MSTTTNGPRSVRPFPLIAHGAISFLLVLFLFCIGLCHAGEVVGEKVGRCIESEKEALLAVRAGIWGAHKWLFSWEGKHDCCGWRGVRCDDTTGHVVKLDLRYPYETYEDYELTDFFSEAFTIRTLQGHSKVNSSLLNLPGLRYLDLSRNDFGEAPIPGFMGSLVNLEYLNLSDANFAGTVPSSLGSLRNLRYLDLSQLYFVEAENLHWLSHLSHLQYLDMSEVDLATVTDWLHAVNMLPSLSVLHLSSCRLQDLPTTLPRLHFTSISTIDLSSNHFNSTCPLWLLNISTLVELRLGYGLHGPIPSDIGNLKSLQVLSLEGNAFEGPLPGSLWELNNLKILHLSGHNLSIPPSENFGNFKNLHELEVGGVVGRFPQSLGNISSLRRLGLFSNVISELPESLGNLSSLEYLSVADNIINGRIPHSVGHLINLKDLTLEDNDIGGVVPESLGNLRSLESLVLITSSISAVSLGRIGNLCNLTYLKLADNNIEAGVEVTELIEGLSRCTGVSRLEDLDLAGNGLGGHLPEQLGQLSNLKRINLSNNSIVGSLPATIGELKYLRSLHLNDNKLSGLVPSGIGKLSNLSILDISSNGFAGVLSETHFANLSRMDAIDMSHNALSLNNISRDWVPPFQLEFFWMRSCKVGPEFPTWLQTQTKLRDVDLSYNVIYDSLPDKLPSSFLSQSNLNLSYNQLNGILPLSFISGPFYKLDLSFNDLEASQLHLQFGPTMFSLDLSNNLVSGPILSITPEIQLQHLDLSHNQIDGSIPQSICQLESLKVLDLSNNLLSGGIPQCWGNTGLLAMKLSNNFLSGPIPHSIGNFLYLKSLHLDGNHLTGEIPSSLKYCRQLVTLDIGHNRLLAKIPTWLGESLSSLRVLRLRSNMFYGNIPVTLSQLQSLQVLDLSVNRLSGGLLLSFHNLSAMVKVEKTLQPLLPSDARVAPSSFEESVMITPKGTDLEYTTILSLVTIIDLSSNQLYGHIPDEIVSLRGLRYLNLSRNNLKGNIPEDIGEMSILESLDLSFNQLSGTIPISTSNMSSLSNFNVSYNDLSGKIPSGRQLQTFDQSTYAGNSDLCGTPLPRTCPGDVPLASEDYEDKEESQVVWLYLGLGPGFVLGFWGFLGVLLLMGKNRRYAYFRFIDYVCDVVYVKMKLWFRKI